MSKITIFGLGILRGIVAENDPYYHFGSLMAYKSHEHDALQAGIIENNGGLVATELGKLIYNELALVNFSGRAYSWPDLEVLVAMANKIASEQTH